MICRYHMKSRRHTSRSRRHYVQVKASEPFSDLILGDVVYLGPMARCLATSANQRGQGMHHHSERWSIEFWDTVCLQHVQDCPGSLKSDLDQWTWPAKVYWCLSLRMHENGGVPTAELSPDIVKA